MTTQIEELRFNGRPWRLDWIGRLSFPSSSQSEPRISVYLSELDPRYRKVLSNESLAEPRKHRVAAIKVGQLPLLRIGSVWLDGVPCSPAQPLDEVDLVLHHSQIDLLPFDGAVEIDGESTPVLPSHRYRIGAIASREVSGSWLAIAHNPSPGLRFVAIPSTVLFQKCMATSPKAIRRLVYGQLDKIIDPQCGFYASKPDTFYVNLFKDFRDAEAPALASLIADPVGRREYYRFRNTLVIESANFDRSHPESYPQTHIKMGLPFSNPVQMKVRGKFLPFEVTRDGEKVKLWGFLATEIIDLKVRLVFEHLVVDRKNSGKQGANAGDPDLPYAFGPKVKAPTEEAEPVQPLTSDEDPATNLDKLSLEACGGFTPVGLNVITEAKEVQQYQAWPVTPVEGAPFEGVGTTGDARGSSGLAEANLEPQPVPKCPITLEHFLETLDLLGKRNLPFKSLIVSDVYRKVRDHVVNYLPRNIKNVRSWHLASDSPHAVPRGYVVAGLFRGGVWHYLVELERKGSEALALAYVRHHAGEEIDRRRFHYFMIDVARENGWNAVDDYKHWVYQPIRHTPSRGATAFANAIATRLC